MRTAAVFIASVLIANEGCDVPVKLILQGLLDMLTGGVLAPVELIGGPQNPRARSDTPRLFLRAAANGLQYHR